MCLTPPGRSGRRELEGHRVPLGTVGHAHTEAANLVQRWPKAQMELLKLVKTGVLRICSCGRDDMPRGKTLKLK